MVSFDEGSLWSGFAELSDIERPSGSAILSELVEERLASRIYTVRVVSLPNRIGGIRRRLHYSERTLNDGNLLDIGVEIVGLVDTKALMNKGHGHPDDCALQLLFILGRDNDRTVDIKSGERIGFVYIVLDQLVEFFAHLIRVRGPVDDGERI